MKIYRKTSIIIGGTIAGLALVAFLYIQIVNYQYRNRIPEYTVSTVPSLEQEDPIQNAVKKANRNPSAKNLGNLGMLFHSNANYDKASQCYELAIEKSKSDWKWNYYLAHLNMELGKQDIVIENFNAVLQINPDVSLAWYYLGETYSNQGDIDLAKSALIKVSNINNIPDTKTATRIDHFPIGAYSMFLLSKIQFDNGQPKMAEENINKLLDQYEYFGPAYRLLGNIYKMNGDVLTGEEYDVRAIDVYPVSQPVDTLVDKLSRMSRSELYLLKKIDEAKQGYYIDWAIKLTEHGLRYMPDNKFLISKAIELYLWNGLTRRASPLTALHISHFKDNYSEIVRMGGLFYQNEMYTQARDYFALAWAMIPENITILETLAISTWNTGDKQKALDILNKALELNQDNNENLAVIADVFLRFGFTEKAIPIFNKLNRVAPQNPKYQKLAGKIAELYGNTTAAITSYETSFKGDPEDIETINSLGDLYLANEMYIRYLEFSKEVIEYHPNDPKFLNNIGSFLLACPVESLRNLDEGIYYTKRAFINIASGPALLLAAGRNLTLAYIMKGDKKNALKTIKKTIDIGRRTDASEDIRSDLQNLYRSIQ